jgi:hypothetical protein
VESFLAPHIIGDTQDLLINSLRKQLVLTLALCFVCISIPNGGVLVSTDSLSLGLHAEDGSLAS